MTKNSTAKVRSNNYAAIDIGSNAVRLLIKHAHEEEATPHLAKILLLRVPLRLGFDVFATGRISEERADNMVRLMKAYRQLMKIYRVEAYRACATSAMRDAKNSPDVIREIEKKTGIRIEIIDGQEEAKIVYNNHLEYMENSKANWLYVDVGGGSTEINLMSGGQLILSRSYNIGTVRILENAVAESEWSRLETDMTELEQSYPGMNIIGSGGNINKLYRLSEKKKRQQRRMPVELLEQIHAGLKELTVEQRMEQYNLKPDRADVIVPAGEIFLTIARLIKSEFIYAPELGLSDGIIDGLYMQNREKEAAKA